MIQRKQSLFLLVAVVLQLLALSMSLGSLTYEGQTVTRLYSLWYVDVAGGHHYSVAPLFALLIVAASVSLITIFLYARRVLQARLCLFCSILMVVWYGCYTFYMLTLTQTSPTGSGQAHIGWAAVFPFLALVLLLMARSAILADERLVRAADRIR